MAKFTSLFCIAVMALAAVSSAQPLVEDNAALERRDIPFDKRTFVVDNNGDQECTIATKRDSIKRGSIKRGAA